MIVLLLTIIAIGVLLCSEPGKIFLGWLFIFAIWLIKLAVILGILCLLIYGVTLVFTDKNVANIVGTIALTCAIIYVLVDKIREHKKAYVLKAKHAENKKKKEICDADYTEIKKSDYDAVIEKLKREGLYKEPDQNKGK